MSAFEPGPSGATSENDNTALLWYSDAFKYWEDANNCPISDDGVLGGYGRLTPIDVRDSNKFLDNLVGILPNLAFDKAAGTCHKI